MFSLEKESLEYIIIFLIAVVICLVVIIRKQYFSSREVIKVIDRLSLTPLS